MARSRMYVRHSNGIWETTGRRWWSSPLMVSRRALMVEILLDEMEVAPGAERDFMSGILQHSLQIEMGVAADRARRLLVDYNAVEKRI